MDYLVRRGDMWLKFDKDGQPEYGFYAHGKGNYLQKFVPMTDKKIDEIILPYAINKAKIPSDKLNTAVRLLKSDTGDNTTLSNVKKLVQPMVKKYLKGETFISSFCFAGCFEKGDRVRIIVPFTQSIGIGSHAFDEGVQPELILLKKGMDLHYVHSGFYDGTDYQHANWALIGKNIVDGVKIPGYEENFQCDKEIPSKLQPYYNFIVKKPNDDDGNSPDMSL